MYAAVVAGSPYDQRHVNGSLKRLLEKGHLSEQVTTLCCSPSTRVEFLRGVFAWDFTQMPVVH